MRALIRGALIPIAATTVFAACTSFSVVQPSTTSTSTSSASGTGGSDGMGSTGGTAGTGGAAPTCTMPSPATDNEPNDTPETATCLSFEQSLATSLNPTDKDVDYYTFQGTKGEAILILASPPNPDRYNLTLLDANKTDIATDIGKTTNGVCPNYYSDGGFCNSSFNNYPWSNKNIIETVLPETGTYYVRFSDCSAQKNCPGGPPPDPSVLYSLELHRIATLDASGHKFNFETSGTVTDKTNGSAKIDNTVYVTKFAKDNQNNYAASVFYGDFNTTTDTDFFKFNMPPGPQYKDGYVAGFRPVPAGPNGDGSSSRVGSLAVFDASGMKTMAYADLSVSEAPELRVLLQAGTDYYLRVRQPAGTVAGNNFYFVYYYPEAPNAVEMSDATNSVIDTPEDYSYSILGNLSAGDDDYYRIPVSQGSSFWMSCSGQRIGSGLRGLTISAFAGSAGHAAILGTVTPDSALDAATFFVAAAPANETSVIVKISATSSDPTISGNYYLCGGF